MTELGVAIVEGGGVFGFHLLIPSFELLLEHFDHFLIHHTVLCVRDQNLTEFNRLVLVDVVHDNVSQIE